ncbi:FtsW/RodA/SpoVE family cell cycle protein, partial [Paenibacillus forsythiae]
MKDYHEMSPYLAKVCEQVKARSIHPELRRELGSHLQDLADERESQGYVREEAVQWAMQQMGDPATVGQSLNRIHRPRMNWGLVAGALLFAVSGIVGMFSLSASSYASTRINPYLPQFGERHLVYVCMALLLMLGLSVLDYRKLRSLSWPLYALTLAGMLAVQFSRNMVNGVYRWLILPFNFAIDVMGWSPYLLIVALAGIWGGSGTRQTGGKLPINGWRAILLIGAPILLYWRGHVLPELVLFAAVSLVLFAWLSGKWRRVILIAAGLASAGLLAVWNSDYYSDRLSAALNPAMFSDGAGYIHVKLIEAVASAGWWGHGFGAANEQLPYLYSDMLFPYLIYSFGWAAGFLLAGLILWFV